MWATVIVGKIVIYFNQIAFFNDYDILTLNSTNTHDILSATYETINGLISTFLKTCLQYCVQDMLQPRCIYAFSISERQTTLQNNKLKKKNKLKNMQIFN